MPLQFGGNVKETLKSNLRERVTAITLIPDNMVTTVSVAADGVIGLKPVQGVLDSLSHVGDGAISFLKKQAEITRRWTGQVGLK